MKKVFKNLERGLRLERWDLKSKFTKIKGSMGCQLFKL
jgi:hypothetical protein